MEEPEDVMLIRFFGAGDFVWALLGPYLVVLEGPCDAWDLTGVSHLQGMCLNLGVLSSPLTFFLLLGLGHTQVWLLPSAQGYTGIHGDFLEVLGGPCDIRD